MPVAPVASLREQVGKAAAAAVLGLALAVSTPDAALAKDVQPYAGLTPCKSNAAFAKREKAELKTLTKRLKNVSNPRSCCSYPAWARAHRAPPSPAGVRTLPGRQLGRRRARDMRPAGLFCRNGAADAAPPARFPQYEEGSAPALALNATMEKTKTRFKNYGEQGLLCGADGLPHLIVDGNLAHLGEFTYPGLGFLYVAGWIGYAGRAYVISNKESDKPLDGEIIIDVPKALNIMFASAGWPVMAAREWQKGTLLEDDANITVSPR